jgi:single-strand DNA-binding protein
MNQGTFIGRIGKDAVTRFTASEKAVTGFSVAVDVGWGDNKKTLWLDCAAWGERFQKVGEFIKKGDRIGVTGEVGTREHDGKTYVTLNVREVTLLNEKKSGVGSAPARGPSAAHAGPMDDDDPDRIPF